MPTDSALHDLPETPAGWAARWKSELDEARKGTKTWWDKADKVISRYLDDRSSEGSNSGDTRLNLFTANTQTMEALLYGKTPQVDVARRFADSDDDEARVASEMLERLLNTDIEDSDAEAEALRHALSDRLKPGMGNVRLRYVAQFQTLPETPPILHPETGEELAPAVPEQQVKSDEQVEVDYQFWKDQLWSPCKTFADLRWWAFKAEMSRDQFEERFGKEKADDFEPNRKQDSTINAEEAGKFKDTLQRCDVWEIWSKERGTVDWYIDGASEVLDHKDDPLELESFWPCPRPMFANTTTGKLMPLPDYCIAQDLYEEVDNVSTRITLLEKAIRVVGVYDKQNDGIKRLLTQTSSAGNEMIPVEAWAVLAEKGGIKGVVDWFPLEMVVAALDKLREYRTELIGLLYQVTGMSDIMRGQASEQTTATEQAIKARFASVRVQSLQDEFARFCSDVQKIKAEIIAKHFDPQTIIDRSNVMRTEDGKNPDLVQAAVQLIKSDVRSYRVTVNPDSVSLTDFAALKQERFEWASALSNISQAFLPMIQELGPGVSTLMLECLKWTLAGMKGSNSIEGVFDQFLAQLKAQQQQAAQNPQPPPEDPKLTATKIKAQAEMGKAKATMQQTGMDMQHDVMKHQMDMARLQAEMHASQQAHVAGIQSEEAKARTQAIGAVNKVTEGGPT